MNSDWIERFELRALSTLVALGLAMGAFVLAPSAIAADEAKPPAVLRTADTWYAETLAEGDRNFRVSYLWSKKSKFRAVTMVNGHPIITMVDGPNYYTVDALTKRGISIARSPRAIERDKQGKRPFGDELELTLRSGGEKVGTETIGGGVCDLYQLTNDTGRVKVCVTQTEPPLPVRIENFRRQSARTEIIRYVNWISGMEIPDSFFKPGSDVQLEHVGYEEYLERSPVEPLGPAPPIYGYLLHGD